ncbi:UDP-N-acetylmuramoyl-L-alanyl-D-glutamate--2,6-diaminopimelate ligase [Alkaliphilus transvaalensis]|uniref:UDP-N-acetylmuramoyl-L-alanyl-D-glutamate--2, 6-diaminopimelate ligase n=1 Tax=Alkaliphilus transvaalensis TaxID=114628 RepID=UPI000A7F0291|nr:UDP-N-acetylmuramoyl-L-alanyl-D-glutamate--2,6-diaminopimelate ligase [Alkaliphilus transvaalensis]
MPVKLQELIDYIEIEEIKGETDLTIEHVYYNSQKVTPNSLFICIKGFRTDGHLYVEDAIKNGAKAILCEDMIESDGVTVIRVKNTRRAMAKIANKFYDFPSKLLDLIGVTGTNGKTSVTYMIKSILERSGRKAGLIGTIATMVGEDTIEAVRTTPESLDLQKLFSNMAASGQDSCVMEVSSHSLDLERVEEIDYKIGVFTNLSPDHLDFHQDLVSYRNAKKKLFYKTSLCNVINIDDADGKIIAEEVKTLSTPLYTYGIENDQADFKAKNIDINFQEVTFDVEGPDFKATISMGIPVKFAIYNALSAIVACHMLGIPSKDIVEALDEFRGVPGRFELIKEIKSFSVIVDYAHTPDALENVLKAARGFSSNKIITVFGCGGDRDQTKRAVMGELAGNLSDLAVITSDNPRTEDPVRILAMVEEGINRTKGEYAVVENRKEAIRFALKNASEGDIVIIAGKGHEKTQVIRDKVYRFDDLQVAIEVAREEGLI